MRRNVWYLGGTIFVIAVALVAVIVTETSPVLGLDLQGGISVVLAPVGKVKKDALDEAVNIIRNRVDALGVAEPEIDKQGNNIIVDLPGVRDRDKARRLVGKTAELRFRPVAGCLPAERRTTTPTTAPAPGATTNPADVPTTSLADDKASATVILKGRDACGGKAQPRYQLGSTLLTGKAVKSASSSYEPASSGGQAGYGVTVSFTSKGGNDFYNKVVTPNIGKPVAIVLDGTVQSAPVIGNDLKPGSDVRISGSSFTSSSANDLATVLRFGALPVQLKNLTTENVSPTLGKDQLRAGIVAGVIGLILVALYMLAYYRLLGLVVISGLVLSALALYALVSWLGQAVGLVLTLAGVTGLIVSVGITVDSYVVYFERLKDEVKTGRTIRSSVDRGFTRSFRTIVAADLVSLIGALVLYLLAIGSVRGFAFFLGLSTLLDLALSYFYMHPLVSLLARRPALVRSPAFGIGAGLDVREATA